MSHDLEDTFGPEFADQVQQRIQERRAEREKISDKTKAAIADKAINEEAFKGGDPIFTYTTEEGVTHDVLLMQLADPREGSVWGQARKLESGAVSVPLDYLGDWVWSIFNDEDMAKKMQEEEWYIVVGNLTQWEPEDGEPRDQLSPVRGIISLDEAKQLAEQGMEEAGFDESAVSDEPAVRDEEDEQEEQQEEQETSDQESEKASLFGGGGGESSDEDEEEEEDEEPPVDVTYSEVANVVEDLGDEEDEVWGVTPDHSEFETFMTVVMNRLGLDMGNEEALKAVSEMAMDRVDEGPAEDNGSPQDRLFG